jgi:hypothetical protein
MTRPTETAQSDFGYAFDHFKTVAQLSKIDSPEHGLAMGLTEMCTGLQELSSGVRATYMVLEEIRRMLQRSSESSVALRGLRP